MNAIVFDTLLLARKLEASGFTPQQAQGAASALSEVLGEYIATRADIQDVRRDIRESEQRITIRLGGMMAAGVAVVGIMVKLF